MRMRSTKKNRITESDLKNLLKNKNIKVSETRETKNLSLKDLLASENNKDEDLKIKRENRRKLTKSIIESLKNCEIFIDGSNVEGEEFICLWFSGARIMTLNEILRTIQTDKFLLFKYKKEWQNLINRALIYLPKEKRPFFKDECSFTLFRQGVKHIDLDGFQAAFKYAIDALCYASVLSEDNPNIMHETKSLQVTGKDYICGIKIEKTQKKNNKTKEQVFSDWFNKSNI